MRFLELNILAQIWPNKQWLFQLTECSKVLKNELQHCFSEGWSWPTFWVTKAWIIVVFYYYMGRLIVFYSFLWVANQMLRTTELEGRNFAMSAIDKNMELLSIYLSWKVFSVKLVEKIIGIQNFNNSKFKRNISNPLGIKSDFVSMLHFKQSQKLYFKLTFQIHLKM